MMWNQINILIYLSLIAIRFYFAEMSIVIIRKKLFWTRYDCSDQLFTIQPP